MEKLSSVWSRWKKAFARIHPVYRSVILFLFVLLLQSAYTMVAGSPAGQTAAEIDIIVRTSAAAIFGYVLSANFISHESGTPQSPVQLQAHRMTAADGSAAGQQEVGVAAEGVDGTTEVSLPTSEDQTQAGHVQVTVATGIGLFCLLMLLALRNTGWLDQGGGISDSSTATVVQFRDFVSSCVGFLIGHPTHPSDSTL